MDLASSEKTIGADQLKHAGRRVEIWRRDHGRMSQRDFADRAGVSVGAVQSLEAGTRATRLTSLVKIATCMQLTIAELIAAAVDGEPAGYVHPDPRVLELLPDDVQVALWYQRAPGPLKCEIRDLLVKHYDSIDPRYKGALPSSIEGSFSRNVTIPGKNS